MSRHSTYVDGPQLSAVVRQAVAEVLMVPLEEVGEETALIGELGAESIDFLDLIFRIEDALGVGMSIQDLEAYVKQRNPKEGGWGALTPRVVAEFVRFHRGR